MKAATKAVWILFFILSLAASACAQLQDLALPGASTTTPEEAAPVTPAASPVVPTSPGETIVAPATIESLEVITGEQTAEQIVVRLRGILSNSCAQINDIVPEKVEGGFTLTVLAVQKSGADCSEEMVPFEETVALDVSGLDAGSYNVTANDRQVSFELAAAETGGEEIVDAEESTEVAATADTGTPSASVSGIVWHDSCANIPVENAALPPGCVLTAGNTFQADGLAQGEEGVAGVEVSIGEGECPAAAVASTLTGDAGRFEFNNLVAAQYCLFIDMTRTQNQGVLGAGSWTEPGGESPQVTVSLGAGDVVDDINFGWDFLDLPIVEEADLVACTNSFEFVADLSIPDDTAIPPGESFTKEWKLRNNGTCPWSLEYSLLFVGGDQMSAAESIPLEKVVAPGEELDVAIDMVTPDEPGTYRGNWQVADAAGNPFGIDGFIEDAFWLQIVVAEDAQPVGTPLPNSAMLGGVVWDDFCLNSEAGRGCVEFPEGSAIFVGDGTFGPGEASLSDIRISLAEGACPADGTFPSEGALITTSLTDSRGLYRFENLAEGTYCVFMDALDEEMVDLLIPGNWTWPGTGVGQYSVALDEGEQILDLDFGWDFVD